MNEKTSSAMDNAHWSSFWRSGSLTSLPQDFKLNYEGSIKSFWWNCAKELNSESRILDVATGNGAIAILFAQFSRENQKAFKVDAVDLASIDKQELLKQYPSLKTEIEAINFTSNTAFEALVEDNLYDLIVSQYGFEYCDWPKAASKAKQLLNTSGKLVLVTHSPESAIVKLMKDEQLEYKKLEELGFFSFLNAYLTQEINFVSFCRKAKAIIPSLVGSRNKPILKYVQQALTRITTFSPAQAVTYADDFKRFNQSIRDGRARLDDILSVKTRLENEKAFIHAIEAAGLELVDRGELLHDDTHLVGNYYHFTPA